MYLIRRPPHISPRERTARDTLRLHRHCARRRSESDIDPFVPTTAVAPVQLPEADESVG